MKLSGNLLVCAGAILCSAAATAQCRDPWVSQAVYEVTGHRASTTNSYNGDCNINNYGGGHWVSYPDLVNKVRAHFPPPAVRPPVSGYPANAVRPGVAAPPVLAPRNGSGIVSTNSSNIVSSGGGNIVSSGAGNIVASGAGNLGGYGGYRRGSDDLKLAAKGDPQAMYHAGMALAAEGPEQNLPEAYKWFSLAADHGVAEAADERKAVKEKLSAEQVKAINLAVKNWKPQTDEKPEVDEKPEKK